MIKKTLVGFWEIIREHRTAFLTGTLLPGIFGLFLAETVMAVQFNTLQPILGGMTFLTVEAFGAWLTGCTPDEHAGAEPAPPTVGRLSAKSR